MKKMQKMKKSIALALSLCLAATSLGSLTAASASSTALGAFGNRTEMLEENYALARRAAGEGIVLLENRNSALPLAKGETVSLFGVGQVSFVKGGTGSGLINTVYASTLLDGMRRAASEGKIVLDEATSALHEDYYNDNYASETQSSTQKIDELVLTDAQVAAARAKSDVAVYTVSRIQGEGSDRTATKGDYYISDAEAANLARIDAAGFDKFIVVLNVGTAVDTSFVKDYGIDSLVMAWLPGAEGGNAVADVLCGDVNPSGKLTDTFVDSYENYPSASTFNESNSFVNYFEDIYNGYRYFETFDEAKQHVNYCFGYGLSYTTFSFTEDSVSFDGDNVNVSVKVTNTGDVAGKEVVQVYFSAPQGLLGKPAKELAAYAKTGLLGAGESETVTVSFPIADMSSFDDLGKTGHKGSYVLEAGAYGIYIGNSVRSADERGVKGTYNVAQTTVTEELNSYLTPINLSKRLVPASDGEGGYTFSYEGLATGKEPDGSFFIKKNLPQVVIEAEDCTRSSSPISAPMLPDNTKYVTGLTSGEWLEFDINAEGTGFYSAILKISNAGAAVTTPFEVYLDDALCSSDCVIASTGSTSSDFVFEEFDLGLLPVEEGKSTVKILSVTDAALDIDSLVLRKVTDIPTIVADAPNVIEAETFFNKYDSPASGTLLITTEYAFGETLVSKLSGAGSFVEYRFIVEAAGKYDFLFNYAATSNVSSPYNIYVNGTKQNVTYTLSATNPGTLADVGSAAYYNTAKDAALPFQITLPEGYAVLRIETAGNSAPNINKFTLTKAFEMPDGYRLVEANKVNTIEAESYSSCTSGIWKKTFAADSDLNPGEAAMNALTGEGRYLEYLLFFEKEADYKLVLNVASTTAQTNGFRFLANGVELTHEDYVMPKTSPAGTTYNDGDIYYHTYADTAPILLHIPQGAVVFRIETAVTGQMPNFNKFIIKPNVKEPETQLPGYALVSVSEPTQIEAESYVASSGKFNKTVLNKYTDADVEAGWDTTYAGHTIVENFGTQTQEDVLTYDTVSYNLFFEKGGKYALNINYSKNSAVSNPFDFYIGDEQITATAASFPKTSKGSGTYLTYFCQSDMPEPYEITVPQGNVTFTVKAAISSCPNLNYFTFTKIFDTPDGFRAISPDEVTKIQAETWDVANSDAPNKTLGAIRTETGNGNTYAVYLSSDNGGRYLEYKLYAPYGGTYELVVAYAAATASSADPFTFKANGVNLPLASYTLPKSAPDGATTTAELYYNTVETDPFVVELPAGEIIFRVTCGKNVPNFDYMTFNLIEKGEAAEDPAAEEPEEEEDDDDDPSDDPADEPDEDETVLPLYRETDGAEILSYLDVVAAMGTEDYDDLMDAFLAQLRNIDLIRLAGGHPPVTTVSSSMGRIRQYDIPAVSTGDGGAGLRLNANAGATCWPCSTMLACTWNKDLIEEVGEGVGKEARAYRVDCWLAPGMNIHRNPLCGRNFEYYSEDPLITGNCAAQITLGCRVYGCNTVPKHFAFNNKEGGRNVSDSRMSERCAREIYLRGFEILVKTAHPKYIMSSYNLINGTETSESHELLTDILRDEWGFDGIVMTDWSNNSVHSNEIKAGNNIKKQTGSINELIADMADGTITREELKENARVILETLPDSMSMEYAVAEHPLTRSGETAILAKDFAFAADELFGVALADVTYNKKDWRAGQYFEGNNWTPGMGYSDGTTYGMSVAEDRADTAEIDWEQPSGFYLDYAFDVEEAGYYDLYLYMISSGSATIMVDGEVAGNVTKGAAARDENPVRTNSVKAYMSEGRHIVRVKGTTGNITFERIVAEPNFEPASEPIDCKIVTTVNESAVSKLTKDVESSSVGNYTHVEVDENLDGGECTTTRYIDFWNVNAEETVYKVLAVAYRTNWESGFTVRGSGSIPATDTVHTGWTVDKTVYGPYNDVGEEWDYVAIPLTADGNMYLRQIHIRPFGNAATTPAQLDGKYFDFLYFGLFKTEEDAERYFRENYAQKPVSGSILLARDYDESYYDDTVTGYVSAAKITLEDADGNTVAYTDEAKLGKENADGLTALSFGFDVPDGTYTLRIKKAGYREFTKTVTVTDGVSEIGDIDLVCGDITDSYDSLYGDGCVDVNDFIRVVRAFRPEASAKLRLFTDINEDGIVTVADLAFVKAGMAAAK